MMIKFILTKKDEATWIKFFKEASICDESAIIYAKEFIKNDIRTDTLAELNRADLAEMKITKIGDRNCILKQAKINGIYLSCF
jgi:hypothetical protein